MALPTSNYPSSVPPDNEQDTTNDGPPDTTLAQAADYNLSRADIKAVAADLIQAMLVHAAANVEDLVKKMRASYGFIELVDGAFSTSVTYAKVTGATAHYESGSPYLTYGSDDFTVQASGAGAYRFEAVATFRAPAADWVFELVPAVNGTEDTAVRAYSNAVTSGESAQVVVHRLLNLSAADVVSLSHLAETATAVNLQLTWSLTRLEP